jgi:hypothetical protein
MRLPPTTQLLFSDQTSNTETDRLKRNFTIFIVLWVADFPVPGSCLRYLFRVALHYGRQSADLKTRNKL